MNNFSKLSFLSGLLVLSLFLIGCTQLSNFAGEAVKTRAPTRYATCTDSDGGVDYFKSGSAAGVMNLSYLVEKDATVVVDEKLYLKFNPQTFNDSCSVD